MRWLKMMRFMRAAFAVLAGVLTLFLLVVAIVRFDASHAGRLLIPFGFGVPFGLVVLMLHLQIKAFENKDSLLRGSIEACSKKVFDQPGTIRPEYDITVTQLPGAGANFVQAFDGTGGFTTEGTYQSVRVAVASHGSVAGRQMGEFVHVYSYVCVDALGATDPFFLTKQGFLGSLANVAGFVKDVQIGDEAFDAAWIIHADQALAANVLDPSIRARLDDLMSKVSRVSVNVGVGTMSVLLTRHGLSIRWPGEMTPELAIYMRDLLLDMRVRLLAHLDRRAHAGLGTGYRLAEDPGRPPAETGAAEEEAEAVRGARGA